MVAAKEIPMNTLTGTMKERIYRMIDNESEERIYVLFTSLVLFMLELSE